MVFAMQLACDLRTRKALVLYILYKLARTCYRSIIQFLRERGLALQVAQVRADLLSLLFIWFGLLINSGLNKHTK